jgi:hypothetical protein
MGGFDSAGNPAAPHAEEPPGEESQNA